MPILEGVLIDAFGDYMTLTCSDTNLTITATIEEYEDRQGGKAVIPARKLLDVVRKLPENEISIEVDGTATIRGGKSKVSLPTMDPEEFPEWTFADGNMLELRRNDFERIVDGTKFAVSTNEGQPLLQNVLVEIAAGRLTATATDRHRLARQVVDLPNDTDEDQEGRFVAPVKFLEAVASLRSDSIKFAFVGRYVFAEAGNYQYRSALLDGTYPDVSRVIPGNRNAYVFVNTKELLQALELAEKVIEEKAKVVRFDFSDGELFISAKDGSAGMEETVEATVEGERMKLAINAKYMIDALKCIESQRTKIDLLAPLSPVILRSENDETGLHLVLPYRTDVGG